MTARTPPWHRRLEARVIAGVGILWAGSLGVVWTVTSDAITSGSLTRTTDDLQAARSAFYRLVDDRAEFASAQASLVAGLPVFRAYLSDPHLASGAADAASGGAMADDCRRQLKADFCVVADRSGRWTARAGPAAAFGPSTAIRDAMTRASAGTSAREIAALGNRLFLVVSEPARFAGEVRGTLTVGYPLDDAVAGQLAAETHCEVTLVAGGDIYASSLSTGDRSGLAALASAAPEAPEALEASTPSAPSGGHAPLIHRFGRQDYAVGAFRLSPSGAGPQDGRLLLLHDWMPTELFIGRVRTRLLASGTVVLVLALVGGVLASRRLSAPLQDLAHAAEDIARGNWSRQVTVRGGAEATMMADAFNAMTANLRQWYEEARKRDDELRQAQKMEAVGRLAGGVAHHFNNLLTAMEGYSELVLDGLDARDPHRRDVGEIVKAAGRGATLTRQLLVFSRRQIAAPRVIPLGGIVRDAGDTLQRLIGEDIRLETVIPPALGLVRADPAQIEQVVLNLAVNARDAVPRGGTIRVELADIVVRDPAPGRPRLPVGGYVRLSVTDTGTGMSPETVARIFEPFFTTKEEGHGTGLGLAIVHGIIEQAGGAIHVDSAIGRGTTFHVYLPHATGSVDAPGDADAADRSPMTVPARGSETVLLVEDEPRVATLIANSLRNRGYTVLEAMHGEHALGVARAHDGLIDLLLTDVVMPGMNGRELAERMKLLRPDIPVLYMSGYSDGAVLRKGIRRAAVHFIQKPFSMEVLTAKMRQAMRGAPAVEAGGAAAERASAET